MSLDTLANVKLAVGVSGSDDDDLLEHLMLAADDFVERQCGRNFAGGDFTEFHSGGTRLIFLANFPVEDVASVKVDSTRTFGAETVLDPSKYVVHPDRGVIVSLYGPFLRPGDQPATVKVEYSTPTGSVPATVARAYAELIGFWFRQAKTAAALGQVNTLSVVEGDVQTNYPAGQAAGFPIPPGVLQLLSRYRVPAA